MARVTVEDCLKRIPNRFFLVHATAKRVRQLREGSDRLIDAPDNEDIVCALREIAAGKVFVTRHYTDYEDGSFEESDVAGEKVAIAEEPKQAKPKREAKKLVEADLTAPVEEAEPQGEVEVQEAKKEVEAQPEELKLTTEEPHFEPETPEEKEVWSAEDSEEGPPESSEEDSGEENPEDLNPDEKLD